MLGFVYKLSIGTQNADMVYIGSTKHSISIRMSRHNSSYNRCKSLLIVEQSKKTNKPLNIEILECINETPRNMSIETFLKTRERVYFEKYKNSDNHTLVNKNYPIRSAKERYLNDRPYRLAQMKMYYQKNKHRLQKKARENAMRNKLYKSIDYIFFNEY